MFHTPCQVTREANLYALSSGLVPKIFTDVMILDNHEEKCYMHRKLAVCTRLEHRLALRQIRIFLGAQPSSIWSSLLSSSFAVSISFLSLLALLGDVSRAMASQCADFTSSPISRYTFAIWNTTLDSSGDESRSCSRSSRASCERERIVMKENGRHFFC